MIKKKINKPWGNEELIELNKSYCFKKLFMKKGHRCSLQFHKKKIETLFVFKGDLYLEINKKNIILKEGESITLNPGDIHRMSAKKNDVTYYESSTPELDDVVRVEDDYGRKN